MDLYCPRCGEPWELYYVQHEMTPEERQSFHDGSGCPSCANKEVKQRPFRAELAAEMGALLGSDVDGLAAEMEDAEYLLGSEFWK